MAQYYYLGPNNVQMGPVDLSQLRGLISLDTMVWCEGMTNWMPAHQVPEVANLFIAPQPQPQPPYQQPQPQPQYQQPYQQPYQQQYQQPQYQQYQQPQGEYSETDRPQNYLVWAILATLFCCWPFGIPAIVFAAKVDSCWNKGDYAGAFDASKKAKMWTIISAACGGLVGIIYAIYFAVVGVTALGFGAAASGMDYCY